MQLQRTTIVLLLLALGLGSFVYFHEFLGARNRQEAESREQPIFSFTEPEIQSLTLKTNQQILQLERQHQSGQLRWVLKAPLPTPASTPAVSYLMDLLVQAKREHPISVGVNQLQDFGLAPPQAVVTVKLKNQQIHQLILGKPDFNGSFLYARAEEPANLAGKVEVILVSMDFANAVNRPLTQWQAFRSCFLYRAQQRPNTEC